MGIVYRTVMICDKCKAETVEANRLERKLMESLMRCDGWESYYVRGEKKFKCPECSVHSRPESEPAPTLVYGVQGDMTEE